MKQPDWNNVPAEVWTAYIIQSMPFIGVKLIERYNDIVKRYPEYFPDNSTNRQIKKRMDKLIDSIKVPKRKK
jgi:hypothetical protein